MLRKRRVIFLIVLIGFLVLIVFEGIPFILGNFKYSDRVIIIDAGHGVRTQELLVSMVTMKRI